MSNRTNQNNNNILSYDQKSKSSSNSDKRSKSSVRKDQSLEEFINLSGKDISSNFSLKESPLNQVTPVGEPLDLSSNLTSNKSNQNSQASSILSSIDVHFGMKNLNDSINLYRDEFRQHNNALEQSKAPVHASKTQSTVGIYTLGADDELKCGACCIGNLNFKESFFCKPKYDSKSKSQIKLSKSQSTLDLNELACKINMFNPFDKCKHLEISESNQVVKSSKSYESLYTASECSKQSNLSVKLKYDFLDTIKKNELLYKQFDNNTKAQFKKLESMSVISNNLDLTLNSSSTISFMNNSQNTNNFSSEEKLDEKSSQTIGKDKSVRIKVKTNKDEQQKKQQQVKPIYDYVRFMPLPVCKDLNGNLVLSINLPENTKN
ncbi:unnamed protein product [Brachionus calyciflorus]|uniref:Uncharacterized protein n=1 Tax=Brachionus calyciflorus TaxID=104777 RepID=A0A813TJ12_9BILA|nr:unnamed protein product [Brachionus calyciflorus]